MLEIYYLHSYEKQKAKKHLRSLYRYLKPYKMYFTNISKKIGIFAFVYKMKLQYRMAFFIIIFFSCLVCFTSLLSFIRACSNPLLNDDTINLFNLFTFVNSQKSILCKNIENSDFVSSKSIENSKIAIVLTVNGSLYNFKTAVSTTKCYASHFGYQWHLLNSTVIMKYANICNQSDVGSNI